MSRWIVPFITAVAILASMVAIAVVIGVIDIWTQFRFFSFPIQIVLHIIGSLAIATILVDSVRRF